MEDRVNKSFDTETSFKTLELINSWIIAADNKSSILIALITLLVGLSGDMYKNIMDLLDNSGNLIITLVILFGLMYVAVLSLVIYHLIEVFIARTKEIEIEEKTNLISYLSIAKLSKSDYISEVCVTNEENLRNMILSQVSINSKIATRKMKHFNKALIFSVIMIPITIVLMILIG